MPLIFVKVASLREKLYSSYPLIIILMILRKALNNYFVVMLRLQAELIIILDAKDYFMKPFIASYLRIKKIILKVLRLISDHRGLLKNMLKNSASNVS